MLGWSINLFRVRGIMISMHYSFLLLLAYVCYEGWQDGGAAGLWWSAAVFLAIFICVVLHEFGHSFTAMRFGIGVRGILLMPIGGMAQFDSIPRRPSQELLITVAGPAVNFAIAVVLWLAVDFPENWNPALQPSSVADLARLLILANLFMGTFNLIPAFPMDGGRILRAFLAMSMPYLRATYWAVMAGRVVAVLCIAASLLLGRYLSNEERFLLPVLFLFILTAGSAEYRGLKRQALDEARWETILRLHMNSLEAQQPPILDP
jgi:Zn-dependent protease